MHGVNPFHIPQKGLSTKVQRMKWFNMAYPILALFIGEEVLIDSIPTHSRSMKTSSTLHMATWRWWDDTVRKVARIKPLDLGHLICIKKRRYLGSPFTINGMTIRRFDPILELHLNNRLLVGLFQEEDNVIRLAKKLLEETHRCFPILADYVGQPEFRDVQILYGLTFIHRGIERFGFQILPVPNQFTRRFLAWYLRNIFLAFNPTAQSFLKARPQVFVPRRIVISKDQFIRDFGIQ